MNKSFSLAAFAPHADGVTDDTPALRRCFEAVQQAGGGLLTIPPGSYRLAGAPTIPLSSNTTVRAHGARFLLPEHLGDRAHLTLFAGRDLTNFAWHGGHFEGYCFDHRNPPNTWEPNVCTRVLVIETSRGGVTADLLFRDISARKIAGAVITVQGCKRADSERGVETFATRVRVQDCTLLDSGKFMWDYGLLWQILVWPEEYTPADVALAWRYFRQDLVRRPIRMREGDDRVGFDNTRDPIAVSRSAVAEESVCFFGDALPANIVRGRQYYVVDAGPAHLRVAECVGGPPLRFVGSAGPHAGLITNLAHAFYHLFWPIGTGPGKGAVDLVACRQTNWTGNTLSALGDTMHLQCCQHNVFANNQIVGSRMGAFFIAEYCQDTTVTGNTVDGTNGSRVMSVEKSSIDTVIVGNTFRNGGRGTWINQPQNLILQGNVFINNTTKCERQPWRGRKTFVTGDYERYAELSFTLHEPQGRYGPVLIRNNIIVTGPECEAAIMFARNGHDLVVDGNQFTGATSAICVAPGCDPVQGSDRVHCCDPGQPAGKQTEK